MLAAALISCALLMALFGHQHLRLAREAREQARRGSECAAATRLSTRPMPATLYRDAPLPRTDWTKLEAYDPLPLHEFDWSEPRTSRDGNANS